MDIYARELHKYRQNAKSHGGIYHVSCIMYHVCLCAAFRRSKYSVAREKRTRLGLCRVFGVTFLFQNISILLYW